MKNKKFGFTLVETMVAITVLVMIITGPIALAVQSLKASSIAKNNFIATNLAQEGVELIRLYRANNVLQNQDWLRDLVSAAPDCHVQPGCYVDAAEIKNTANTSSLDVRHCPAGTGCPPLLMDANGFYNYSSGATTIFTRTIFMTAIPSDKVRIISTISWTERFGNQSFSVEEIMHNWLVKP